MANILTLSGAGEGVGRVSQSNEERPTDSLTIGKCKCVLNTRTNKGVSVCRVPKGNGPGETRSGIKLGGTCPNPVKTKTK